MMELVQLAHGEGGHLTRRLVQDVFVSAFDNSILRPLGDSALLPAVAGDRLAFTTDSFVIKPLFFPGGDIGKLAVCGTVNDLAAAGARPLYLSLGIIIEEGFRIEKLKKIVQSMAAVCQEVGIQVVAGDTKVVEHDAADGVYINTSGIGVVDSRYCPGPIRAGDEIVVTGNIAAHGMAVAVSRFNLKLHTTIASDCAPLAAVVEILGSHLRHVKAMRDVTRGGLATVVNELAMEYRLGARLHESAIPIDSQVQAVNMLLGFDPLYVASEGLMLIAVAQGQGAQIAALLRQSGYPDSAVIGSFHADEDCLVYLETRIGGQRILNMLEGIVLPRIC